MSIFSSPQKRIAAAAEKVQNARKQLDAAELEHRTARCEALIERLDKVKGNDLRPSGQHGPIYDKGDLVRQLSTSTPADSDLARYEQWCDGHDAWVARVKAGAK